MKKLRIFLNLSLSLILLLSISFSASAKKKRKLKNTVLWKIEGKKLKEPSYLLGTFHILCADDFKISDKIKRVLEETEQLAVEVDLTNPETVQEAQKLMTQGNKRISEQLSSEQFEKIDSLVQVKLGMPLQNLDHFGLSFLSLMFIPSMMPCSPQDLKMLDQELMKIGAENQKKIVGLETVKEQITYLKKAMNIDSTYNQLINFETEKIKLNELVKVYTTEDLNSLKEQLLYNSGMDAEGKKWMLDVRNENWVNKMPEIMKEKSTLFAVGTGHLVGEKGLINLLRKKGYRVKPVFK